jgi:hypothetical protein
VGSFGLVQPMIGNKFLFKQGFMKAVGATTTRAQQERDQTPSTAITGNPAFTDTGIAGDAQFSINSDGADTALTHSGSLVLSASESVNDQSGSAAAFYNNPQPVWRTLRAMAEKADAYGAAGKLFVTGNEMPDGDCYFTNEVRTVTNGTATALHTTNFVDGDSFGAPPVRGIFASGRPRVMTKVSSSPGQDQYTVTSDSMTLAELINTGTTSVLGLTSFGSWVSGQGAMPSVTVTYSERVKTYVYKDSLTLGSSPPSVMRFERVDE